MVALFAVRLMRHSQKHYPSQNTIFLYFFNLGFNQGFFFDCLKRDNGNMLTFFIRKTLARTFGNQQSIHFFD